MKYIKRFINLFHRFTRLRFFQMKKSLKNRILLEIPLLFVVVMVFVSIVVSIIIGRQNRNMANTLIRNSFNMVRYTISERQEKLLFRSHLMASLDDMGENINYIQESSQYFGYSTMRPTYMKVISVIYGTSNTADIWKSYIYNSNGNLIAFANINENGSVLGYIHDRENIEIASLKQNEELAYKSWTKQESLPEGIEYNFGREIPTRDEIYLNIIDSTLCIIAHCPVMAKEYNPVTEKMEGKQVGLVVAFQKIGIEFVKKISDLSGTEINIFGRYGLISGTCSNYKKFDLSELSEAQDSLSFTKQPVIFNEVNIAKTGYFQGALPIYSDSKCIAAVVSLYSKKNAKLNTASIIKILAIIYVLGTILIMPTIIFLIVNGIINPIKKVAFMMRQITREKDFAKTINVDRQDEIGGLADSFNEMIRNLQRTTTSIDNLNREIEIRKKAEQKLERENEVRRRTEEKLKNTQSQLVHSEKLAGIGQLAAGMAHEINNPVGFVSSNTTTIVSYIDRIKKVIDMYHSGTKKEDIEKAEKDMKLGFVLEDIEVLVRENIDGLSRITQIVQNLRDFSRIDQKEKIAESDINEGIQNALLMANKEIKYHAEVKTDFGKIPSVVCNIGQINQVFLNILINAVQAIKEKNSKERKVISVKTYNDNESVYCEISDNGPGISESVLERIFEPFFTTRDVGKGTGLGLSICYDIIVNKHKGDIKVKSKGGEGTTFVIRIPKMQAVT